MIKTFTQNDLVRYIYQETTQKENTEIENALIFDETLNDEYNELLETVGALHHVEVTPSQLSIDRILSYSKSYDLHAVN